jgi:4-hydroxyacetophenone monooxygenase
MSGQVQRREATDAAGETWSPAEIEQAVGAADPMVLRGMLYYLTGDEAVAATKVEKKGTAIFSGFAVTDPEDVKLLRARAVAFVKRYLEQGEKAIAPGVADREVRSMDLTVGEEIPREEVEMWQEELGVDPWVHRLRWPKQPTPEQLGNFSVLVIGAGLGGLNCAVHLKRAGIAFKVLERNDGVGGTWWENRYPGCRVDTPSRAYAYIYGLEFDWPNPYSGRDQNQRYLDWIADTQDVRKHIQLNTEVTSVVWDEKAKMWEVTAKDSTGTHVHRANAVISAVGIFSRMMIPKFDGIERFKGPTFHSSRWPANFSTKGKRVAVIGTGATGYQLIPEVARDAAHTFVFQRTPQWVMPIPGYLAEFPPAIAWLDKNFPMHKNFMRLRTTWLQGPRERARMMDIDPEWKDPHTRSAANKVLRDMVIDTMQKRFKDRPDLMEKMVPNHPLMSARPVIVDDKYSILDVLLQANVSLVTDNIQRITKDGIVTKDGVEHKVDVIVFATGFRANDFLWPMEVKGQNGQKIEELWAKDGPRAYLGTMLPGFPNFFMMYGPNTNPNGAVSVVNHEALTTRWLLECVGRLILEGKRSVTPTAAAYNTYNEELDRWEKRKIYIDPRATNYYQTGGGRSAVNNPIPGLRMWNLIRHPNYDELIVE